MFLKLFDFCSLPSSSHNIISGERGEMGGNEKSISSKASTFHVILIEVRYVACYTLYIKYAILHQNPPLPASEYCAVLFSLCMYNLPSILNNKFKMQRKHIFHCSYGWSINKVLFNIYFLGKRPSSTMEKLGIPTCLIPCCID